jgi:hypothetical protein
MFGRRELLMGTITLGVVAGAGGCGGGGSGDAPTTPSVTTAPAALGAQLYDGQAFAIAYPGGWWVHNAEQPGRTGTQTTILDPADHARRIRIEVAAHAPRTPRAQLMPAVRRLRRTPGYSEFELGRSAFRGRPALRWEFVHERRGRALHTVALLFADERGRGILLVTQAPQDGYRRWAPDLRGARDSFLPY